MKKFCIYAICKNESKFVERWYNSIKDADYICVLDTGSTDNTLELLANLKQQHPEQIIYSQKEIKPWRFDTARNESMKLIPADADILVSADLDDVFQYNWKSIIEKYIDQGYNKIIGSYPYYDVNNNITYNGMQDRVCLNDGNSHWENGIHERLVTLNEHKINANDFIIEHRQDLTKPRRECYLEAAKNSLEPGNFYGQLCYGYELYNSGYTKEAIDTFTDLYAKLPKNSEYLTRKWVRLVADMYGSLNNKAEQLDWLSKALLIDNRSSPFENYVEYEGTIEAEIRKLTLKVCVYAICKNELKNIDNWLKPLKTADYICILDTGSTDGTYEKLVELAKTDPKIKIKQKVYDKFFFDTARNDSLQLVRDTVNPHDTNILLCLDFDEYASDNIIEALRNEWQPGYEAIEIYCKNVNMNTVKGYLLTDELRWQYKVHEAINCENMKKLTLSGGFYNHYQDLSKERNYYKRLQQAYEEDPTCIHYLTYLIWEASLHNDTAMLKKYCEENMVAIISNEKDQYYKNWQYYIYTCIVYLNNFNAEPEIVLNMLNTLNAQDESYREYYVFKADLCNKLQDKKQEAVNLTKAMLKHNTKTWLSGNFKATDAELYTRLVLIYYYDLKDYEKAYLYADKALSLNNSTLYINNLSFCKEAFERTLYEK